MAVFSLGEWRPRIPESAWVADSANLIGAVQLGEDVSVWFGAVLRGDTEPLVIGRGSNIQDGSVLHTDPGSPLVVGEGVTVGHQVMLHGCSVGDGALIGIQAVVLNNARIGKRCLVGAGSLVTEGKEFPEGWLVLGRPAKAVRPLTPQELEGLAQSARSYVQRMRHYRGALERIA